MRQVAETIPGKTTELFSQVAKKHAIYIIVGMPELETESNLFFNSAVLIDPNGEIAGVYRKHSHLMESSWSSLGRGQVPVFETIYGKLAILICADISHSELSAQAVGAKFLILPTNGGVNIDLLKVRALEGECHVILSNRYGNEKEEYLATEIAETFNEETFTLLPPFSYDFQDGKSLIVDTAGEVKVILEDPYDSIGYCNLTLQTSKKEKVVRRPELYALLGHNTLDSYCIKCMNLPNAGTTLVAAANLKSKNLKDLLVEIKNTLHQLSKHYFFFGNGLRLVVFPANILSVPSSDIEKIINHLKNLTRVCRYQNCHLHHCMFL